MPRIFKNAARRNTVDRRELRAGKDANDRGQNDLDPELTQMHPSIRRMPAARRTPRSR
jgi:hypothetical protein